MGMPLTHNSDEKHCTFTSTPVEVLLSIYCDLVALRDIMALSSNCYKFENVWNTNVIGIYYEIGLQEIQCER